MKINCLSCGHTVDLDDIYEDYEGRIKCFTCGAVLKIRTEEGKLRCVEFEKAAPQPTTEEVYEHAPD